MPGSALQAQGQEHRGRLIGMAALGRGQPIVAQLAFDLHDRIQFVDQPGDRVVAIILARLADIIVVAVAQGSGRDQPAPQRVIDLHADVAAERGRDALQSRFIDLRHCRELHRGQAGGSHSSEPSSVRPATFGKVGS